MASSRELSVLLENAQFRLEQGLARCAKGEITGELYFDVGLNWRVRGTCRLLLEADTRGFATCLGRSAQTRIEYLAKRGSDADPDPNWYCLSKNLGFEDALAAGLVPEARRISDLSPKEWLPDAEDEDDHRFALFLHLALAALRDGSGAKLPATLDELPALRDDAEDPRAGIARAIAAADAGELAAALEATLDAREEKIRALRKTPGVSKELLATEGALWIEGLAILRVAELAGIAVPPEARYLPAESRVAVGSVALPAGAWLDVSGG